MCHLSLVSALNISAGGTCQIELEDLREDSSFTNTENTSHNISQLRENQSLQFCAADQLSVGAAEQLRVGAGWAGMVWADMHDVLALPGLNVLK